MFSFFKKSVVSQPDTAPAPDFGMLGTEKQQKLVDCTHKLDAILQKRICIKQRRVSCLS